MPAPKFTPRNYFNAAQEHLGIAGQALRQPHPQYFVAHFFAGLAVEEMLRALSVREGDTFDGTHSIEHWAKKANVASLESDAAQNEIYAVLDDINARWRANQRYYTLKMLDAYLESAQLDKIRGDRVKYSSKRLFDLASVIIEIGEKRWLSNNKSKKS